MKNIPGLLLATILWCCFTVAAWGQQNNLPFIDETTQEGKLLLQFLEWDKAQAKNKGVPFGDLKKQYAQNAAYAFVYSECLAKSHPGKSDEVASTAGLLFALSAGLTDQKTALNEISGEYEKIEAATKNCEKLTDLEENYDRVYSLKMMELNAFVSGADGTGQTAAPAPTPEPMGQTPARSPGPPQAEPAKNDSEASNPPRHNIPAGMGLLAGIIVGVYTYWNKRKNPLLIGIEGWLLFFIIAAALSTTVSMAQEFIEAFTVKDQFPQMAPALNLSLGIVSLYRIFVYYSLYSLASVKENAVKVIKIVLIMNPLVIAATPLLMGILMALTIPEFALSPERIREFYDPTTNAPIFVTLLSSLIWFTYFCKSRRVANTWAAKFGPAHS